MAEHPLRYVWLDLETTGAHEDTDPILEVELLVCDETMRPLEEGSWVCLDRDDRLAAADSVVRQMHEDSGLTADLASGLAAGEVEDRIVAMLRPYGRKHDFVLCGSGVSHFDSRFLRAQLPRVARWFRYYTIDVAVLRRSWPLLGRPELVGEPPAKAHRALADARQHLEEFLAYRTALSRSSS